MLPKMSGKGPWSFEEDNKLHDWVKLNGPQKWSLCSDTIPGRSGKQCRERWFNNLNPNVKKGNWTAEEDDMIFKGYLQFGSSWSRIAKNLEGRTENSVKNRFYSTVRKLLSDSEKLEGKSSEQQIRNIIEMSLGRKVGVETSNDKQINQDNVSLLKQECQSDQENDGDNKDIDDTDEKMNRDNIKQKNEKNSKSKINCKKNSMNKDQLLIMQSNDKSQPQIKDSDKINISNLEANQNEEHDEEMSSHQVSGSSNIPGMMKRKYNRKSNQDEYSESNLLYRLLKSNDVTIKNTKCLQDYSVFYRKYKQKKHVKKDGSSTQNDEDEDGDEQEDAEEGYQSSENMEEQKKQSSNRVETRVKNSQQQQQQQQQQQLQQQKDDEMQYHKFPKKKLKVEEEKTKDKGNISNEKSSLKENHKDNIPDKQQQQQQLQQQQQQQQINKYSKKTDESIDSSECLQNKEKDEAPGEEMREIESELLKYFQKSMGQFLKKFIKKSKNPNGKEIEDKSKKIKSKISSSSQQENSLSDQAILQEQIQEEISKQIEQFNPSPKKILKMNQKSSAQVQKLNTILQNSHSTHPQQSKSESSPPSSDQQIQMPKKFQPNTTDKQAQLLKQKEQQQQSQYSNKSQLINMDLALQANKKQEEQIMPNRNNQIQASEQNQTNLKQQIAINNNINNYNISLKEDKTLGNDPSSFSRQMNAMQASFQSQRSSFQLNRHQNNTYRHSSQQQPGSATSLLSQPYGSNQNISSSIQNNNGFDLSHQNNFQNLSSFQNLNNNTNGNNNHVNLSSIQSVIQLKRASPNIDIQNIKDMLSNTLLRNSPQSTSNPQIDQKMMFLLNQLNTLESMLSNTKQELVKLEASLYQKSGDQSGSQQFFDLNNSQDFDGMNQYKILKSLDQIDNSKQQILQQSINKDNTSQFSDLDKFDNHNQ